MEGAQLYGYGRWPTIGLYGRWPTIGMMKGANYADNEGGQIYG